MMVSLSLVLLFGRLVGRVFRTGFAALLGGAVVVGFTFLNPLLGRERLRAVAARALSFAGLGWGLIVTLLLLSTAFLVSTGAVTIAGSTGTCFFFNSTLTVVLPTVTTVVFVVCPSKLTLNFDGSSLVFISAFSGVTPSKRWPFITVAPGGFEVTETWVRDTLTTGSVAFRVTWLSSLDGA